MDNGLKKVQVIVMLVLVGVLVVGCSKETKVNSEEDALKVILKARDDLSMVTKTIETFETEGKIPNEKVFKSLEESIKSAQDKLDAVGSYKEASEVVAEKFVGADTQVTKTIKEYNNFKKKYTEK